MTPDRARSNQSRAEQIRQKRQQSSQERVNQARQQATRVSSGPAVNTTVRRSSPYTVPLTHSQRSTPARKVHYAQTGNGVEVRLPALPQIQLNWQMASAFFAIIALTLVIMLTSLDTFQVKNVEVTGISRVSAADVQAVVDGVNHSIFTLDRQTTINAIESAFPELTNIHLRVGFPNSVILTVKERQPIVSWNGKDQTQWIDAEGVVMPARGDGGSLLAIQSSVSAPFVATTDTSTSTDSTAATTATTADADSTPKVEYIDPQVLQTAISLGAQLPEGASLIYDPINGMGWTDSRGWKVFFGLDLSNIQMKLTEYQAIVDRLTALGIKPSLISVEHIDAPYYSLE